MGQSPAFFELMQGLAADADKARSNVHWQKADAVRLLHTSAQRTYLENTTLRPVPLTGPCVASLRRGTLLEDRCGPLSYLL
jgi:hypothetical protein